MLPLDLLEQNEHARVIDIDGPTASVHRLDEMGLRPGVVVRVIKSGSPCILAIGEIRLSFRPAEDSVVLVEPIRE